MSSAEDIVSRVIIVKPKYGEPGFARSNLDNKENLFSALNSTLINNINCSENCIVIEYKLGAIPGLPFYPVYKFTLHTDEEYLLWRSFMGFNHHLNF